MMKSRYLPKKILHRLVLLGAFLCIPIRAATHRHPIKSLHTVLASWYGPRFDGKRTASGEIFHKWAMTVASRTLPIGTKLELCNPKTRKCVRVRVNDRGPYVAGRGLDVSERVATLLGFKQAGLAILIVREE